jgi:hypothetical protein
MKRGRVKGDELLLTLPDALELIDCLEGIGEVVTGVDVWYLIENKPVESTLFLPLHDNGGVHENADRARRFISVEIPQLLASGQAPDIPAADLVSVGFMSELSVIDSLLE